MTAPEQANARRTECAPVDEAPLGFPAAGIAGEVAGDGPARAQPLPQLGSLALALRQSRDALGQLQGELDAILAVLRDPSARPDAATADRLRGAAGPPALDAMSPR